MECCWWTFRAGIRVRCNLVWTKRTYKITDSDKQPNTDTYTSLPCIVLNSDPRHAYQFIHLDQPYHFQSQLMWRSLACWSGGKDDQNLSPWSWLNHIATAAGWSHICCSRTFVYPLALFRLTFSLLGGLTFALLVQIYPITTYHLVIK